MLLLHFFRWCLATPLLFIGLGMIKHGLTLGWRRLGSASAWTLGGLIVGTVANLLLP